MPTYSIKAPNGQTYQINGPAGATDDQVRAQVLKQHPDAGGAESPEAFNARFNADFNARWLREHPAEAARRAAAAPTTTTTIPADRMRNILADVQAGRAYRAPTANQRARITRAPTVAPKAPPTRAEMAEAAGRNLSDNSGASDMGQGLLGGLRGATFGLADRATAALEAYLPSSITGNRSNANYTDILNVLQSRTRAEQGKSLVGNLTGQVAGAFGVGGLASKGIARVAEAGTPYLAPVANFLQRALTLRRGQAVANTAKVVGTGAVAGGLNAAGTNEDIPTGIVTGAVAAPVVHGAGKLINGLIVQPVAKLLRAQGAGAILRKYIGASAEEVEAEAAAYRARTGHEPTVAEILPAFHDREQVRGMLEHMPSSARDLQARLVRERAAAVGPEMAETVRGVTQPHRERIARTMAGDLANARGGAPVPGDPELVARAARSPTDLLELRDQEARAIMAPHEATPVASTFGDILPQHPVRTGPGTVVFQDSDPAVTAAIRSATPGGFRAPDQGVTAGDVSDMIQTLRGDLSKGGIEGRTAQRAIDHLEGFLQQSAPEAAAAHAQMTDAYAARSRMAEGMQEGGRSRLRDSIDVGTSRRAARTVRNAFDTPEGSAGRTLGQASQLEGAVNVSPTAALRATAEIAENPTTQRAITENLGGRGRSGERIGDAAAAQTESMRRLAGLTKETEGAGQMGLPDIARSLMALSPHAGPYTRMSALKTMGKFFTQLPAGRSERIVNALFSRNPLHIADALKLLHNSGDTGRSALRALATTLAAATIAGDTPTEGAHEEALPPEDVPPAEAETPAENAGEPAEEAAPPSPIAGLEIDPNRPYGRQVIEHIFPGVEVTEDVRDPNSALGEKNPESTHITTQNTVDVRPIPGMTFDEFVQHIKDTGVTVLAAIDEVKHPSAWATGPHWHVEVA